MKNYIVTIKDGLALTAHEEMAESVNTLKLKYGDKFVGASFIGRATLEDNIRKFVIENYGTEYVPRGETMEEIKTEIEHLKSTIKQVNVIYRGQSGNLLDATLSTKVDIEEWCKKYNYTYVTKYGLRNLCNEELINLAVHTVLNKDKIAMQAENEKEKISC